MDVIIDISQSKIETDRLILRFWQEADLDDFFEYASVAGVGERAGWNHHESIDDSRTVLRKFILAKTEFAIVYKENGKVIGSVGLHQSWANDDPDYAGLKLKDVGYVLSKDYWGKGIMPEAVKALIDFSFNTLNLDALTSGHSPANNQSRRVIEKCGFEYVKTSEYHYTEFEMTTVSMRYILPNPNRQFYKQSCK